MPFATDTCDRTIIAWKASMAGLTGDSVRSGHYNGLTVGFVKTLDRKHVYVHDKPNTKTVIARLDRWLAHYNGWHPYEGVRI